MVVSRGARCVFISQEMMKKILRLLPSSSYDGGGGGGDKAQNLLSHVNVVHIFLTL